MKHGHSFHFIILCCAKSGAENSPAFFAARKLRSAAPTPGKRLRPGERGALRQTKVSPSSKVMDLNPTFDPGGASGTNNTCRGHVFEVIVRLPGTGSGPGGLAYKYGPLVRSRDDASALATKRADPGQEFT